MIYIVRAPALSILSMQMSVPHTRSGVDLCKLLDIDGVNTGIPTLGMMSYADSIYTARLIIFLGLSSFGFFFPVT